MTMKLQYVKSNSLFKIFVKNLIKRNAYLRFSSKT